MTRGISWAVWVWAACFGLTALAQAEDQADYVPRLGEFPPADAGRYFAGELVVCDPINRRGGLRLDGDLSDDRYHRAPPHRFALLPYGMVWLHGAPAELRDVPIGTHLHGVFLLPPEGDTTIPPSTDPYVPKYNHALLLEDDFSFYQRRGQAWKIAAIDLKEGKLKVAATGGPAPHGLSGEQTFEIDEATHIWKGRSAAELADLAPELTVQLNLTWSPQWQNRIFRCSDVWIDEESRAVATERQRRTHRNFQHHRWLAGWVDHVEHQPGGRGIVSVTLFGGMDPSLYEEVKTRQAHGAVIAASHPTLRTYWQDHDHKGGPVVEIKQADQPPLGSSGLQLRIQVGELLEGYRPGRIVRVRPNGWPNVKLPPEERLEGLEFPGAPGR